MHQHRPSPPTPQGQTAVSATLTTSRTTDPKVSILMLEFRPELIQVRPEPTPAQKESKPSNKGDAVGLLLESARTSLEGDSDSVTLVYSVHIVQRDGAKALNGTICLDNILSSDMLMSAAETVDSLIQLNLVGRLRRETDRLIRDRGAARRPDPKVMAPQRLLPGQAMDMPEDPNTPPGG